MIPRFGRVLPFIIAVLGMIDARYTWHINIVESVFFIALVIYLIYFMFMDHASVSPKKSLFHIVVPFLVMATIVAGTHFVFF